MGDPGLAGVPSPHGCLPGLQEPVDVVSQPKIQIMQPLFKDFGGHMRFRGRAATVKCFEARGRRRRRCRRCCCSRCRWLASPAWLCVSVSCSILHTWRGASSSLSDFLLRSHAHTVCGVHLHLSAMLAACCAVQANPLVRAALEEPGEGRVLVVDGGASTR